ncbi:flippase-like domain-containing protein [candidate division KSB1 bacterium]|nr:flippase-like domain-containing protein [candidate division KSB1 bacterium]
MMVQNTKRIVRFVAGIGISLLFLYLVFRRIDLGEFIRALSQINYGLVLLAMAILLVSVWVRAVRWRILLLRFERINTFSLFSATMIGYMGNNVLPFRFGEFMRAYVVRKQSSTSFSGSFATIVMERIIDFISFFFFIGVIFLFLPITSWSQTIGGVGLVLVVLFFIVVYFLNRQKEKIQKWQLEWKGKLEQRGKHRIADIFNSLIKGAESLWDNPQPVLTIGISILLWIMYFFTHLLVLQSFNFDINLLHAIKATLILLMATTLAISIPSAPGYIGTSHGALVWALALMAVGSENTRAAFSVIAHMVGFLPLTIGGLLFLLRGQLSLREMKALELDRSD